MEAMQRKPREVPIAGLIAVVPTALTPGQRCCKLVEDPSSSVSAAALHVLKDHQLSSLELSDLVEKVTSGKTDPSLDSLLLTLLASQVLEGEGSTTLLSFLLDRNSGDGLLQARIRSLLTSRARSSQSGQGG